MGLDMYAFITMEKPTKEVDFEAKEIEELHYWRKHPNLHGWMEVLYHSKGGKESFNCTTLLLTKEDLLELQKTIQEKSLPHTEGFFYGASDGSETKGDLKFIEKALEAINDGYTVFYDSWW